jgi:ion channel
LPERVYCCKDQLGTPLVLEHILIQIPIGILGAALLAAILWDAFESVILPRHVRRSFRIARFFYRILWTIWSETASLIGTPRRRESYLSYFGPLSLLLLIGFWALALVLAFAMMQWAAGSALSSGNPSAFRTDLYFSGTTFFTLGLGDITPQSSTARILSVIEAGTGFGFLALIIAYLPTLYGAFSQREVNISLLDARAGSPPTASELLRRHGTERIQNGLAHYLRDWETWSAQLMETHLTYPFLCFFRSQHDNQSWIAAFTAILDTCALLIAYGDGETKWQAQLTFAICRHAVADLAQIFYIDSRMPEVNRLPPQDLPKVRGLLLECGVAGCREDGDAKLKELRALYEPHLYGLSRLLRMPLPSWGVDTPVGQEKTVWGRITSRAAGPRTNEEIETDHF